MTRANLLFATRLLPLDGGGSETWRRSRLVAAVGVRSCSDATAQGRADTPIQLRLAPKAQGFISFPHQGGRETLQAPEGERR